VGLDGAVRLAGATFGSVRHGGNQALILVSSFDIV
jgi:hypothetical protein